MTRTPELQNLTIAVAFGGRSPEHDVSIITGILVLKTLQGMGLNAEPLYVDQEGIWRHSSTIGVIAPYRDGRASQAPTWDVVQESSIAQRKLVIQHKHLLKREEKAYDLVFPCFHGANGEDGSFQGLMELIRVPYAGPRLAAAAITMDKDITKRLYQSMDIPTTPFRTLHKEQDALTTELIDELAAELGYPLFIKPATLGSSIGITCAHDADAAYKGLELAYYYDTKVVVETAVTPLQDLTVAIMGGAGTDFIASEIQQSNYQQDLLTYEDKYLKDGGAQTGKASSMFQIPADIPAADYQRIKELSIQICQTLNITGNSRVDWLRNADTGEIYANEINTIPGTMYHHLWEKSDHHFPDVLENMMTIALTQAKANDQKGTVFQSTLLDSAGGVKGAKSSNS